MIEIRHKYTGAVLCSVDAHNLRGADLREADLRGADLRGAGLRWANLRGADLREADLSWANLSRANLSRAGLRWANLRGADLREADLRGARVFGAKWPAPTAVLLAEWGRVSDELTRELMIFDGWCHPDPSAFDAWADGGLCPYGGVDVARAANFQEQKELWPRGEKTPLSPLALMRRLIAECCDTGEAEEG